MDYQKTLAFTGPGLIVGGHVFGIGGISVIGVALLFVGVGALVIKRRFRAGVNATDASPPE